MSLRMAPGAALGTALAGGLLTIGAVVLTAAPAHAHDVLLTSDPADGATVRTVPGSIDLTFNNTVLGIGSGVRVAGPAGDVQEGKPKVVDATVTQQLRAGSPAGKYTVTWRVTSSDGHPITGSFDFTATAASSAGSSAAATPTTSAGATPAATENDAGEDTDWTRIVLGGLAGTAAGTAYVLVRRARTRAKAEDAS